MKLTILYTLNQDDIMTPVMCEEAGNVRLANFQVHRISTLIYYNLARK
jgi:hypothetical protein